MLKIALKLVVATALALAIPGSPTYAQYAREEIVELIIQLSIAQYSGSCPCPYNSDRAGRRCGGRSAYSRPGGASPICYPSQVTDRMIEQFLQNQ